MIKNRLKLMSSVKYLAREGLAFRSSGDESDSNFLQLLMHQAENCPKLKILLQKTNILHLISKISYLK